MSFIKFVTDAVKTTATVAAGIACLPVLGAVGTISVAGAVVAIGVGTAAAAADHANNDA